MFSGRSAREAPSLEAVRELRRHRFDRAVRRVEHGGDDGDLGVRLVPLAQLDRLADRRQRLDAVAGVEPRRVDLVLVPGAPRQAAVERQSSLEAAQEGVELVALCGSEAAHQGGGARRLEGARRLLQQRRGVVEPGELEERHAVEPRRGDEGLVRVGGELERPLVVGALWNGKDKPPDNNPGGNPRRVIKSRAGSRIIFDDDAMKLIIEDGGGKGRITFDSNANKILIEAIEGDVCFQSPQGEMKIVAKSATFKASSNVEIHAGGAMKWGTDATAKLDGGSGATLSGQKVNINSGAASAPGAPSASPQEVPDPYGS